MSYRLERIAVKKLLATAFLAITMVLSLAASSMAENPVHSPEMQGDSLGQCSEIIALLVDQDEKNSREFRQIKRDIAALTQTVAEPGMSEILGGVGYIIGLFGVAAYVASRKKVDKGED